jgi:hypothetical protein
MLTLLVAATLAASGNSYCSPSGDLCYGIQKQRGVIRLRITTIERYFARYMLCVTPPTGRRACGSFPIFRSGRVWASTVRWNRQFPNAGAGRYRVQWRLGRGPLGPTLSFRR